MIAYGPNGRFFRMKQPSFISHLDSQSTGHLPYLTGWVLKQGDDERWRNCRIQQQDTISRHDDRQTHDSEIWRFLYL